MDAKQVEESKATDETATDVTAAGGGAHVSLDALGRAFTFHQSIRSLRKRGRHVQAGITSQEERGQVAVRHRRLRGHYAVRLRVTVAGWPTANSALVIARNVFGDAAR